MKRKMLALAIGATMMNNCFVTPSIYSSNTYVDGKVRKPAYRRLEKKRKK